MSRPWHIGNMQAFMLNSLTWCTPEKSLHIHSSAGVSPEGSGRTAHVNGASCAQLPEYLNRLHYPWLGATNQSYRTHDST